MNSILRKALRVRLTAPIAPGAAAPALTGPPPTVPTNVFVTPQTLVTFPVASAVVFAGWQLAIKVGWSDASHYKVPLALALLWGVYLFFLDVTDPARPGQPSSREYVTKLVVALINALFLAASALGVNTAVSKETTKALRTPAAARAHRGPDTQPTSLEITASKGRSG